LTKSGRSQPGPYILLAAVAILLAVASLALFLLNRPPGNSSAEAGFARDMAVHHAQAVEMAEIARDRTGDEQIRILATDIALTQQAQIGRMQGWLDAWGLPATGTEPTMVWMGHPTEGRMPGMATPEEINELRNMPPQEMDKQFLRLMIPHHQAAIPMAEAALERTDRPEVEQLAGAIAATQRLEIENMQNMLQERGAEPVTEDSQAHDHGAHDH
jgi:uncharacterized protein (DUF305 family)